MNVIDLHSFFTSKAPLRFGLRTKYYQSVQTNARITTL